MLGDVPCTSPRVIVEGDSVHGPQPERVVSEADLLVGARVEGLEAAS